MKTIRTLAGDLVIEHPADGIAVMRMPREVDDYTVPTVRRASMDLVQEGAYRIVVDLGPTEVVTSAGLAVLVGMLKRAKGHAGTIALADADDKAHDLLKRTGLLKVFDLFDSVDEAVAALQGGNGTAPGGEESDA